MGEDIRTAGILGDSFYCAYLYAEMGLAGCAFSSILIIKPIILPKFPRLHVRYDNKKVDHALIFLLPERISLSLSRKSSMRWFIFLKVSRSMLSRIIWHLPPPNYLNP